MKTIFASVVFLLISLLGGAQTSKIEPDFSYQYSAEDSIGGCMETARRVKFFMEKEKHYSAIELFSKQKQEEINGFKEDPERFEMWTVAWTINDLQLMKYLQLIEQGKGDFVFEDDIWKIDEK